MSAQMSARMLSVVQEDDGTCRIRLNQPMYVDPDQPSTFSLPLSLDTSLSFKELKAASRLILLPPRIAFATHREGVEGIVEIRFERWEIWLKRRGFFSWDSILDTFELVIQTEFNFSFETYRDTSKDSLSNYR